MNGTKTATEATDATRFFGRRFPKKMLNRNPISGSAGINQAKSFIFKRAAGALPFQVSQCINVGRSDVPIYHYQDAQTNSDFGCGNHHDKEDKHLSRLVSVKTRESSKENIYSIQHELNRHEDDDKVSAEKNAHHPDRE
jgi:hypothetical protein